MVKLKTLVWIGSMDKPSDFQLLGDIRETLEQLGVEILYENPLYRPALRSALVMVDPRFASVIEDLVTLQQIAAL